MPCPKRTTNWKALDKVVAPYKDVWVGFDAQELVEDEDNILLTDGENNYALFEYEAPGIYYGHYMFSARGIDNTEKIARNLLGFFFETVSCLGVIGLVPVNHAGSLRLTQRLGFTLSGVVETEAGPHYEFYMKKEDFK